MNDASAVLINIIESEPFEFPICCAAKSGLSLSVVSDFIRAR